MGKHVEKENVLSSDPRLEKALACLVAATRRTDRGPNLLEVASELGVAREKLGSLKAIAQLIGVSSEMLREFNSVKKLCPSVKDMVRDGSLASVDAAYRLSMLPDSEQKAVAQEFVKGKIKSNELRDVVSYRRRNPEISIGVAIQRVKEARDKVEYVIKFYEPEDTSRKSILLASIGNVVGQDNITSINIHKGMITLILSKDGEQQLREEAKKRQVSKRKLIESVLLEA